MQNPPCREHRHQRRSVGYAESALRLGQVVVQGYLANAEPGGRLLLGQSTCQELQHGQLTTGEERSASGDRVKVCAAVQYRMNSGVEDRLGSGGVHQA
jgi:hypothetical protein